MSGKGGKGGAVEDKDTLSATTMVSVLDLIGQGPIEGLVAGERSIYFDGTPVMGATGAYNYRPAQWAFMPGGHDQEVIPGFGVTQSENSVEVKLTKGSPLTRTVTDASADGVRITVTAQGLSYTDSSGHMQQTAVEYTVEARGAGTPWTVVHNGRIEGKSSARYPESIEISLEGLAPGPFDIRLTRVTDDSASVALVNDLYWSSYTVLNNDKLSYPYRAVCGLKMDARYFGSTPARQYHVRGLKVRVPKNFDPVARIYAASGEGTTNGVWDGTFKTAWTSDPAWCCYDMLSNPRYGAGKKIAPDRLSKWDFYDLSVYASQRVPTGVDLNVSDLMGGYSAESSAPLTRIGPTEFRFSLNCVLHQPEDAYKVITQLASAMAGAAFYSQGMITMTQDRPTSRTALFTNANVIGGRFSREGSSASQRHTAALVGWNDPAEHFAQKWEYIEDRDGVARYGQNMVRLEAFGCTSRSQARRYGLSTLVTERLETDVVSFEAGLDGARIRPGEVIEIRDNRRAGVRWGGRTLSATASSATLDAPVALSVGSYKFSVVLPSGLVETRTVEVSTPGQVQTIALAPPLSRAPVESAIWTLSSSALNAELLRVVGVKESGPTTFAVTAVTYNEGKYAAIDLGQPMTVGNFSLLALNAVPSITGLVVRENSFIPTGASTVLTSVEIGWDLQQSTLVRGYYLRVIGDTQGIVYEGESIGAHKTLNGVLPDSYTVSVRTVSHLGLWGTPVETLVLVTGEDHTVPEPASGFTSSVLSGGVNLTWAEPQDRDYAVTELRAGPTFASGVQMFKGRATAYLWPWPAVGNHKVWVAHHDTSGNVSPPISVEFAVTAETVLTWASLGGKPQDLTSLIQKGVFEDGASGTWRLGVETDPIVPVVSTPTGPRTKALQVLRRDAIEHGYLVAVTPGETLYVSADLRTLGNPYGSNLGLRFLDAAGVTTAFTPGANLAPDLEWTRVSGSISVPANAVQCQAWLQTPGPRGTDLPPVYATNLSINRYQLGATVGAPAGTLVAGVPAATVGAATGNFNNRNDRLSTAITAPALDPNGEAVDHTLNSDGSANVSFEWFWGGNEATIDGFIVTSHLAHTSAPYTLGGDTASEVSTFVRADKRALTLYGVAADKFFRFSVRAFRNVDPDIAPARVIYSPTAIPVECPYQPATQIAFGGNVTGTVNGVSASQINVWDSVTGRPSNLTFLDGSEEINNDRLPQSGNLLANSEFPNQTIMPWTRVGAANLDPVLTELARDPTHPFAPGGTDAAVMLQRPPLPGGDDVAAHYLSSEYVAASDTRRYEFSVWVAAHRCVVKVYIEFYSGSFTALGASGWTQAVLAGGQTLNEYTRASVLASAPPGTAYVRALLVKTNTWAGHTDSYAWVLKPCLKVAGPLQVDASEYTPAAVRDVRFSGYSGDLNATLGAPAGTLVGGTLAQTVEDNARSALADAATAQNTANSALGRLQVYSSDGYLSSVEKKATIVDWANLWNGRTATVAQANVFGIVAERDSYTQALADLADHLNSLTPAWSDTTQDTLIVPALYRAKWDAAYQAQKTLLLKIADESGKRASWSSVVGRPAEQANLCWNGSGPALFGWSPGVSIQDWGPSGYWATAMGLAGSRYALTFGQRDSFFGDPFPVRKAEVYAFSADAVRSGAAASGYTGRLGLVLFDGSGAITGFMPADSLPSTSTRETLEGSVTIPASAATARIWVGVDGYDNFSSAGNTLHLTSVVVKKAVTTQGILPGAATRVTNILGAMYSSTGVPGSGSGFGSGWVGLDLESGDQIEVSITASDLYAACPDADFLFRFDIGWSFSDQPLSATRSGQYKWTKTLCPVSAPSPVGGSGCAIQSFTLRMPLTSPLTREYPGTGLRTGTVSLYLAGGCYAGAANPSRNAYEIGLSGNYAASLVVIKR